MPSNTHELTSKWKQSSLNAREKYQVSNSYRPWTGKADFKGVGMSKTNRVLDLLDLVVIEAMKGRTKRTLSEATSFLKDSYIDVSQSHDRKVVTNRSGVTPTVTTATELYSFNKDRLVLPQEIMRMHGHCLEQTRFPAGMSLAEMRRLAGEGMAVCCIGTVIWCVYLTKHFASTAE